VESRGSPRLGFLTRLAGLSVDSLVWAVGLFCGFIGAFLLVAPHRFQGGPYKVLLSQGLAWGSLALLSGVLLLVAVVLRPRRWLCVAVHVLAGVTLLALAVSFARVGARTGMLTYSLVGLATVFAGSRRRQAAQGEGDLFGLVIGLVAIITGFSLTAFPKPLQGAVYGPYRDFLLVLGPALLLAGLLLGWAQLTPRLGRRHIWEIHVFAGAALVAFGALIALPGRLWTGIALYCGGGIMVAVLPWLRRRLAALDTAALQTRLALALAIATSLALILATALVTAQEEQLAVEQILAIQSIEAEAIAHNVSDYVEMSGARTLAVAALAGRQPLTPESQVTLFAASRRAYPDVAGFRSLDLDGRLIAAVGVPVPPRLLQDLVSTMGEEREPRLQVRIAPVGERSLLFLGAPIHDAAGKLAGVLVAALDSAVLGRRIARPGSKVVMNDGYGRLIAARDDLPPGAERLAGLPAGWDRAIPSGRAVQVESGVAGFARVPVIGWAVAVERPRGAVLAGVRRGRDVAFCLLLAVVPLAVIGGIRAAGRIARPLEALSEAVDELTAGNLAAPLDDDSTITEVARLSSAFREMRDRLAARTRESERLAAELRARAEALAQADRRKDEFLAMLAHELRNPLGAIANASYLIEQLGSSSPPMDRSVAIIRRQIQHLVRLVDDLLDVSRITRGKVELRREVLDLVEIVRNVVDTIRPLAEAKSLSLRLDLPSESLPLEGDATRLEQVFSNLLRNAVKFTPPCGHIDVMAGRGAPGEAVIRVRDDGVGIAADLLPRVFDLFAQGEQALDRAGAGLGIGLTMVRSLVELHGGRVEVRSEGPGRGTEIEVRLPLASA
jgi:signal transduction histidine kinase